MGTPTQNQTNHKRSTERRDNSTENKENHEIEARSKNRNQNHINPHEILKIKPESRISMPTTEPNQDKCPINQIQSTSTELMTNQEKTKTITKTNPKTKQIQPN